MKYSSVTILIASCAAIFSVVTASPVVRRQDSSTSAVSAASSSASSARSSASSRSSNGSSASSSASSTSTAAGASSTGGAFNASSDVDILQYALTLEHLEAAFYNASVGMFSEADFEAAGVNGSYRNQIYSIGRDEASHVSLLSGALGDDAVEACTYNFSSVTDVPTFLATARLLEGVGISAYLGAAGAIMNQTYLTVAGAILTVEARHQSALNAIVQSANWVPSSYDTPLNFSGVFSLAAPYIESCPTDLGLTPFPALTLSSANTTQSNANGSAAAALPNAFSLGDTVTVSMANSSMNSSSSSNSSSSNTTYVALISGVVATTFYDVSENMTFTIPEDFAGGQFYAVLTSSNTSVTDDNTLAGPAIGYVNIPLSVAPAPTATASSSTSSVTDAMSSSTTATGAGASATDAMSTASEATATLAASATDVTDSLLSAGSSATSSA